MIMEALSALKTVTLADGVENCLLEYIRTSGLQPGDLLPREEELAANLNVSRHIVREGVSRLKALGLVESRKRRGMILARPNAFAGVAKLADADLFSDAERREFMGLRIVMELGMVDFIYARKTEQAIRHLWKLAGEPNEVYPGPDEVAFHSALFAIGGNELASGFCEILTRVFDHPMISDRKLHPPGHADICEALEHGSLEDFRQVMKAHFEPYSKW